MIDFVVLPFFSPVAGPPYLLYFCVKFYAADPCRLHEELTRLVQDHMTQFMSETLQIACIDIFYMGINNSSFNPKNTTYM